MSEARARRHGRPTAPGRPVLVPLLLAVLLARGGTAAAGVPAAAAPDLAAAAGYVAALRLHVEPRPALATAYLAFWSGLAGGLPAEDDAAAWTAIQASASGVATGVGRRYGEGPARYRLQDTLPIAVAALSSGTGDRESLARVVDRFVTPRVDGTARYGFGGRLAGVARLGNATALWRDCRRSAACIAAHDALFAPAMGGVSLAAGLAERLAGDPQLAARPETATLRVALAAGLATGATTPSTAGPATEPTPGSTTGSNARPAGSDPAAAGLIGVADGVWRLIESNPPGDAARLRTLLTLGSAAASLAGATARTDAFAVLGGPLESAASVAPARSGSWLAATARIGLLLAGGQALALFDSAAALRPRAGPAAGPAPPELSRLVTGLYAQTSRDLAALRTDVAVAAAGTEAQLAALSLAVDVLKEDVSRIESTQQAQVRASFEAAEGRRWAAFEVDNERCFALRNRDARTGQLLRSEFRRCEDRFLQGAVRRSLYLTRSADYLFDARYLEAADLQFPFHSHYPLLLVRTGLDRRSALALPDPLDWLQQASALVRLYQESPAAAGDQARRAEVLRQVRASGARARGALDGLLATDGAPRRFNPDPGERILDAYFARLDGLLDRIDELDPGTADPFGKRLTVGLDQPLPEGPRRTAIAARLTAPLSACPDTADEAFTVPADGVVAETRRFFDEPITAADVGVHWNRDRVGSFGLPALALADAVPPAFAWAALSGLGTLDACLLEFRPVAVEWSRTPATERDSFVATVDLAARIAIRFVPDPSLGKSPATSASTRPAATSDAGSNGALLLAERAAKRRCSFAYRRDAAGCSRAGCLASVAPALWTVPAGATGAAPQCSDAPFSGLGAAPAGDAPALPPALAERYWAGRERALATLGADVRRSTAFVQAALAWREYAAYAAVALGSYADGGGELVPLLDPAGPLAPESVLRARLVERTATNAVRASLAAGRSRVGAAARARGEEIVTAGGLPALAQLNDTLGRLDILLAAYAD